MTIKRLAWTYEKGEFIVEIAPLDQYIIGDNPSVCFGYSDNKLVVYSEDKCMFVDDLLCESLKDTEPTLYDDIQRVIMDAKLRNILD